ncbi:MAG: nuclear transport factor 2 family protein [Acidobacteriota bacterium]|nr:nuclear transport factor 2 family protein [Acidobacteriota bacterium]
MKKYFFAVTLFLLISIAGDTVSSNVFAQTQKTSPSVTTSPACGESERERLIQAQQASLTPAERLAWREIQERIDRMSHGEEAKDVAASMRFMADDYTLYTLPDKDSPNGKVINRQQIAVYKKQNLASLYSTSPETHTDIESLSMKGNVATIVIHQYYVRVIRGGDGSPHEARTSVRHRETWVYTERGWLQKSVQELERGQIYLDGQPYNP